MPHDEQGTPIQDEAFLDKVIEIRSWIGRLDDDGDPLRSEVRELIIKWNEVSMALTDRFGTSLEVGSDWQDYEADVALNGVRFWWTWGN